MDTQKITLRILTFCVWALAGGLAMFFATQLLQLYRAGQPLQPVQVPFASTVSDGQALTWLLSPREGVQVAPAAMVQDWDGVQLQGIIYAPRNQGHAVLLWPKLGTQVAQFGSVLPNGWTLHSIEPQAIVAAYEGQIQRLELPIVQKP